jgi:hypothetical protein
MGQEIKVDRTKGNKIRRYKRVKSKRKIEETKSRKDRKRVKKR